MYLKSVAIILLNYRQPKLTIECVESLRNLSNNECSIIIVDNDSQDDSVNILKSECADCVIIENDENRGFAAGCNVGIRYALKNQAQYVLLLNNDTVVDSQLVDRLLEYSTPNTVTVPKMYYYDQPDIIWYAGGYIDFCRGNVYHYGENKHDAEVYSVEREVSFATGCCMLIPKTVLESVPLMDENYFLYYEDADYSANLIKNGSKIMYCPEAKLWHKVHSSVGNKSYHQVYYSTRNRFYLLRKYRFGISAWLYTIISRVIRGVIGVFLRNSDRYVFTAMRDYMKSKMGKKNL